MKIVEYTFTGFYPSGNPFDWYYDEYKNCMFTSSVEVATWDKAPKKGDKIRFEKSGDYNEKTDKVYINGELVFINPDEKQKQKESLYSGIYSELKKQKGFE